MTHRFAGPPQEALVSTIPTSLSVQTLHRRSSDLPLLFHKHLLATFGWCQEDTCLGQTRLPKAQWTSPPVEFQLTRSAQTEFVICDYTIEDAFNIVKRLLGLAYFWTGSQRGIRLQIWATWIFYVILVDLVDDVAQALDRPFVHLSIEMIYRGLYYAGQALLRGETTDPVRYLAENARWLGLIKRRRKRSLHKSCYLTNPSGP